MGLLLLAFSYFVFPKLCHMCKGQEDGQWKCPDGRRIIRKIYVCDGRFHCTDGSDEDDETCLRWNCSEGYWKCRSNECILEEYVCDGIQFSSAARYPGCRDLSDEADEMCSTWQCREGYWKCDSYQCIQVYKVCDGELGEYDENCFDESDESDELCATWQCTAGFWKCGSNECIPEENVCDGYQGNWRPKCKDGSDEAESTCMAWNCTTGYWKCGSNQCIRDVFVCDGDNDCKDGSDEAEDVCSAWKCTKDYWKCNSNKCISASRVCDGKSHCDDGHDENSTLCTQWNCSTWRSKCRDGLKCVYQWDICDSDLDCRDGSDEAAEICDEDGVCPAGLWRCVGQSRCRAPGSLCLLQAKHKNCAKGYHLCADNTHCLKGEYWCDGFTFEDNSHQGCPDLSDEGAICEHWECLPDYWKCADNLKCIKTSHVCDANTHVNCKDKSDEHNQLCGCDPREGDWPCINGDRCISRNLVCDGYTDGYHRCNDGSDELPSICANWNCSSGMRKCGNDKCIDITSICNETGHCNEDSAAQLCVNWSCRDKYWECKDRNKCIKETLLCDGKVDCYDKSDEVHLFCKEYTCLPGYTKCANNHQCVKKVDICDGEDDCNDGSDELCNSDCLRIQLGGKKSIIRKCEEDPAVCVPVEYSCNGVAHCPDASDEAMCTCKNWNLMSCHYEGETYCFNPELMTEKLANKTYHRCTSLLDIEFNKSTYQRESDVGNCINVSMGGVDEPTCLNHTSQTACRTISYPIDKGIQTVCVNGTLENESESIDLYSGVDIFCQGCSLENTDLTFSCVGSKMCKVTFINLSIIACKIQLHNVHVMFLNVNLEDVMLKDSSNLKQYGNNQIHIESSTFSCLNSPTCGIRMNVTEVGKIDLVKSEFFDFVLDADVSQLMLAFYEVAFIRPIINVNVNSYEYLRIPSIVSFEKIKVFDEGTYLMNRLKPLRQKRNSYSSQSRSYIKLNLVNPYVMITDSHFSECHVEIHSPRLYFKPVLFSLSIIKSIFENGYIEGNGGGLTITSDAHHSKVLIVSTTFFNNTAVKGHGDLKGSGGGLYIAANSLQLGMEDCLFTNNGAEDSGLALYLSEGVKSLFVNCSFQYDIRPYNIPKGSLLFAAGISSYFSGHFQIANIKPEYAFGPILALYIGQVEKMHIEIECPTFYKHITQYSSRTKVTLSIPDLSYECSPCFDNYYTIASEDRELSFDRVDNITYLNNLLGEKETDMCRECPYGGLCTGNNVIPRPNYWGFWHEGELVFQQCPAGYCCSGSSSICDRFDFCENNRTGILCGSCEEGFSVSILTGVCTPDSQCGGDKWFWLFAVCSAMMYALWYTFKDVIFNHIFTLYAFLKKACSRLLARKGTDPLKEDNKNSEHSKENINVPSDADNPENIDLHSNNENTVQQNINVCSTNNGRENSNQSDSRETADNSYFGIITYYVQIAAVIRIQIEFSDIDKSDSVLDKLVDNIGRFLNLELTQMSFDVCPIVGLTTLGKLFYSLAFLFGIYMSWTIMFISVLLTIRIFQKQGKRTKTIKKLQSLRICLVEGIIEIIKYTYSGFCGIIFTSLVCTKIGSHYVWWYDASHTCLENWQALVIIFAIIYAIPFPFILIFGLKLLKQKKINAAIFICCCLCPLVALWFIFIYKCFRKNTAVNNKIENLSLSKPSEAVISILQGPYRDDERNMSQYWEAMVSIRRLLISSMTLIPNASNRMIIITVLSLVFLIQHIYMSPFQVHTSNYVEALSLALLCVTSVINLLKATLTDSGVVPSGPSVPFFKSLEFCEKMFVFFIIGYILMIEFKLWKKKEHGKSDKK